MPQDVKPWFKMILRLNPLKLEMWIKDEIMIFAVKFFHLDASETKFFELPNLKFILCMDLIVLKFY